MEVSFVLNQRSRKKSSIRAQVTIAGKRYTYQTGVSVLSSDFSKGKTSNKAYNMQLRDVEAAIINTVNYFERILKTPSIEEFREKIGLFLTGHNIKDVSRKDKYLFSFIDDYILKCDRNYNTIKGYKTARNKLSEFFGEKYVTFDEIDLSFERRFKKWLTNQNFSRNYIGTLIKNVIVFMSVSHDIYKLHSNTDYKRFKMEEETADTIYLSMEELLKIHHLKITPELVKEHYPNTSTSPKFYKYDKNIENLMRSLTLAKNKFLIGAVCAMRISDYTRIQSHNIKDGKVTIMPKKGSGLRKPEPITLPMHPIMKEILASGFDFNATIADQYLNRHIKVICKIAGITEPITHYITRGGELQESTTPKYQLVTSHTARRSGATNMDLSGMDRKVIQICTGHSSMMMLEKYLKASVQVGNIEILSKSNYFQEEQSELDKILDYVRKTVEKKEEPVWLNEIKKKLS